jgi:hypothetical protein
MASMCRIWSKHYVLNCRRCRPKINIHRLAGPDQKKSETVAQVHHLGKAAAANNFMQKQLRSAVQLALATQMVAFLGLQASYVKAKIV